MWWRWDNRDFHSDSDHSANGDSNTDIAAQPYSHPDPDGCYCENR